MSRQVFWGYRGWETMADGTFGNLGKNYMSFSISDMRS